MKGHEEADAQRRKGRGKSGKEEHDEKNEPHMVCFPHRRHGVRDRGALVGSARAAGQKSPHPAAEVSAGEDPIGMTHPRATLATAGSSLTGARSPCEEPEQRDQHPPEQNIEEREPDERYAKVTRGVTASRVRITP